MSHRSFVFLVFALSTGCGLVKDQVAGRYGRHAGRTVGYAIDTVVSAGPTLGVSAGYDGDDVDALISVGYHASALGQERPQVPRGLDTSRLPGIVDSDFALVLGLEGGYQVRSGTGFVGTRFGAGWGAFTASVHVLGAYDGDRFGLALGPEVDLHLRLGASTTQHEVQVFLRGDFFVVENRFYEHRPVGGIRLLFDLY